jgi:hypothetical protein
MPSTFDAVVVGAGPAGLSAAAELSTRGECLLVEQGGVAGTRDRDVDLLSGVGGAGLFSDGKHSFFPAASALWTLPHEEALARAFGGTASLLGRFGVVGAPFPDLGERVVDPRPGAWQQKLYLSEYVPLERRLACIEALWSAAPARWPRARVVGAGRSGAEIVLDVERAEGRIELRTRRLVVATGRWSPRWTRPWLEALGARFAYRRVEIGVRLETDAAASIFAALPGVDGKLRFVDPASPFEVRTFCTCREGEVILAEASGLRAYSGRAEGPRTRRSNFGLLVRTHDERLGRELERHVYAARPRVTTLATLRGRGEADLVADFGETGGRLLSVALESLVDFHPALARDEVTVYSPCIEGVGDYPVHDGALGAAPGVQIAGDATGRFRGIVASLVSGRYCALTPPP